MERNKKKIRSKSKYKREEKSNIAHIFKSPSGTIIFWVIKDRSSF
jgi:hypothetical protein